MVACERVPPLTMNELFICIVFETANEPPDMLNTDRLNKLLTLWIPAICVTVALGTLIIISSFVPGSAPVLQLVTVFQSPLPPTHVTVAALATGQ